VLRATHVPRPCVERLGHHQACIHLPIVDGHQTQTLTLFRGFAPPVCVCVCVSCVCVCVCVCVYVCVCVCVCV
jgi:hypothetical protein